MIAQFHNGLLTFNLDLCRICFCDGVLSWMFVLVMAFALLCSIIDFEWPAYSTIAWSHAFCGVISSDILKGMHYS